MKLEGKVAIVTGAGSGIGAAAAQAFAAAGAGVVAADIDPVALNSTEERLRRDGKSCLAVDLDVSDRGSWAAACEAVRRAYGGAQIIFNNAGVSSRRAPIGEFAPDLWDRVIDINLNGVFNGCHYFLSELIKPGEPGHIVNTASICGMLSIPQLAAYVASKFAVVGLSESMRLELDARDIGVSVLCPGFVATNIARNSLRTGPSGATDAGSDAERRAMAERMSTSLAPEHVAASVVDAIERNLPYIFTHREYEVAVKERGRRIDEAFASARQNLKPDDINVLGKHWLPAG